jgi:hypothetical protein
LVTIEQNFSIMHNKSLNASTFRSLTSQAIEPGLNSIHIVNKRVIDNCKIHKIFNDMNIFTKLCFSDFSYFWVVYCFYIVSIFNKICTPQEMVI